MNDPPGRTRVKNDRLYDNYFVFKREQPDGSVVKANYPTNLELRVVHIA